MYQEIPSLDEMGTVPGRLRTDCRSGYWHDAGHVRSWNIAASGSTEYLRRYADRMVGMHVHDTQLALRPSRTRPGHDRLRDAGKVTCARTQS